MITFLIASLLLNAILIPVVMWKSSRKDYYKSVFFGFKREHLAEMEDFRRNYNKLNEQVEFYGEVFDEFVGGAAFKINKLGKIVDKYEGSGKAYELVNAIDYEFSKTLEHLDFTELNKLLSAKLENKREKTYFTRASSVAPKPSGSWSSPQSAARKATDTRPSSGSSRSGSSYKSGGTGSTGSSWTPTSYVYDDGPSSGGYGGSCGHSGGDSGGSSGGDAGGGGCD